MSKAKQTRTTQRIKRRAPTLKTVAAVIKAFGGEAEIAAWTGQDRSWIRNYKRWGYISTGWHWRMMIRLAELGYEVDPQVFGVGNAEMWKGARPRAWWAAAGEGTTKCRRARA